MADYIPLLVLIAVGLGLSMVSCELFTETTEVEDQENKISMLKLRLHIAQFLFKLAIWIARVKND